MGDKAMRGQQAVVRRAVTLVGVGVIASSVVALTASHAVPGGKDSRGVIAPISFAVSNDQALVYPPSIHYLPDEHASVIPVFSSPLTNPTAYNFFVAMANKVGRTFYGGTFVLRSANLIHFAFAPGYGVSKQGNAVLWPPHPGDGTAAAQCAYSGPTHFDEQYAAPGTVVQDPMLPPGNLIMIYEAEIHCPAAPPGIVEGWASVGVARSSDGGKTWPLPVAQNGFANDWLEYGDNRYAGVTLPGTPPKTPYSHFYGDALPSAFVDDAVPAALGAPYVYVPYTFTGDLTAKGDAHIHMARAHLGQPGRLHFHKWYVDPKTGKGGWTQEGRGGLESGVMQAGCAPAYAEGASQITYNDALGVYMLTFDCTQLACANGKCTPTKLSLFYSTATSLETQNWTTPQLIENSTYPILPLPGNTGTLLDGGYPSFMSPTCEPGHLGLSGTVFLLKGSGLGNRQFISRTFTIRPAVSATKSPVPLGSSSNGCKPRRDRVR